MEMRVRGHSRFQLGVRSVLALLSDCVILVVALSQLTSSTAASPRVMPSSLYISIVVDLPCAMTLLFWKNTQRGLTIVSERAREKE